MYAPQDDDALSEVVGFVLLLGICVLALSLYLLYAVPAEGRANEIAQMNMVKDRFTDYKIALDSLWVNDRNGVLLSTAFDLGTGAAATEGGGFALPILSPVGSGGTVAVTGGGANLTITAGGESETIPLGSLTYSSSNNYWVDQNWTYQMGAVFLSQEEGTTVRVGPSIAAARTESGNITLTVAPISLNGSARIAGSGPVRIETRMRWSNSSFDGAYEKVNLTITADAATAQAWKRAFGEVRQRAKEENVTTCTVISDIAQKKVTLSVLPPPDNKYVILRVYPANYTVTVSNAASLIE